MRASTARLLEKLDLVKVREDMLACEAKVPLFEYDELTRKLLQAADLWLQDDILACREMHFELSLDHVVKMVLDQVRVLKTGKVILGDWKTTGDVKRPNYKDEIKEEFQSSLYLTYGGQILETMGIAQPEYIEYRCLDDKGGVVTATKLWDSIRTPFDAESQYRAICEHYDSQQKLTVWERRRPKACFKGGQSGPICPFYDDCIDMKMPQEIIPLETIKAMAPRSMSSMKAFLECPEQFRRTKLLGAPRWSSRESLAGTVFHAGAASLWKQAWERRVELGLA